MQTSMSLKYEPSSGLLRIVGEVTVYGKDAATWKWKKVCVASTCPPHSSLKSIYSYTLHPSNIYIDTNICILIYIYTYLSIYICIYLNIYIYICIYIYIYMFMFIYTTCLYIRHVYTYIYMYIRQKWSWGGYRVRERRDHMIVEEGVRCVHVPATLVQVFIKWFQKVNFPTKPSCIFFNYQY